MVVVHRQWNNVQFGGNKTNQLGTRICNIDSEKWKQKLCFVSLAFKLTSILDLRVFALQIKTVTLMQQWQFMYIVWYCGKTYHSV